MQLNQLYAVPLIITGFWAITTALPQARTSPNGNIALNKKVSCSQSVAHEGPENIVDGTYNGNSKWSSVSNGDKWLIVDLENSELISRWIVHHAGVKESSSFNTRDFSLQKSSDLEHWETVDHVVGNSQDITDRTFTPPAQGRYFRLLVTSSEQQGNGAARIYEFELYSQKSSENGNAIKTISE